MGITLVRNEDIFIEWSVRNALPFCDEFILADHQSSDGTPEILQRLAAEFPDKIRHHRIHHPRESHELLRPYMDSDCWIFGVDGDEIYDPIGLSKFRDELERGAFKDTWVLFGNVLNVKSLALPDRKASGHLAPPCRSMTKLYNFSAIKDWKGNCLERLHGGEIIFHAGFDESNRTDYYKVTPWEQSVFR
ncbi:MAG: glycosyltransferase family 2 protein, partial [Chthoniobacterales bacterium]